MKQLVGSLIWAGQTRFDATDVATVLSTSMISAATCIDKALALLKFYSKTVRSLQVNRDIIWYRSFRANGAPNITQVLQMCSLFTFTDAGYGCLEGSFSTQAVLVAYGLSQERDTTVEMHACLLWCQAKENTYDCMIQTRKRGFEYNRRGRFVDLISTVHLRVVSRSISLRHFVAVRYIAAVKSVRIQENATNLHGMDSSKAKYSDRGETQEREESVTLENVMAILR